MTKVKTHKSAESDTPRAFIEHVNEVRRRLTWIVLSILVFSGVAYAFYPELLNIIQKPIGQTLYYMSPVGGLNFLIKLCVSVGILASLPLIFYQVNKFMSPLVAPEKRKAIVRYSVMSSIMAAFGVVFAYYISLPAALNFLTNITTNGIESLIGVNEYYGFALAYLIGYAVLFQLPVFILLINNIKPLNPGGMMRAQRWIILGSFIMAAILTPTPDPINQLIMAAPAIVFYQVGVMLVWIVNRPSKATQMVEATIAPTFNINDYDHIVRREIHRVFHEPINAHFEPQSVQARIPSFKRDLTTKSVKAFDILPV